MKKIVMKCTQEQFDAVMPRLKKNGFSIKSVTCFEKYPYLYCNVDVSTISNVDKEILGPLSCKEIHETWNEKIFLETCGIEVMKPTLEEVKKYFKNAEKIKDHAGDVGFIEFDKIRFSDNGRGVDQNAFTKNWLVLWHHEKGFAEILTTKQPTYSITAEQLMQLENGFTLPKLKEWFPEVFEVKLENNTWYVCHHYRSRYLINLTLTDESDTHNKGFGFDGYGNWNNNLSFLKAHDYRFVKATEEEVFEALKNEAIKRGFVEGVCCGWGGGLIKCEFLKFVDGKLWCNEDNIIMDEKGKWAKIIPAITKSEAEKLLNRKIID